MAAENMKVVFNGYNLTSKFTLMDDLARPLPDFRHAASEIDARDGLEFESLTVGMRECSFSLAANGKTQEALQRLWRELADKLLVRKPVALKFSDEKDKYGTQLVRYAVPSGTPDIQEWVRTGVMKLTFEQPDPYLYGREHSVRLAANTLKKINAGGNASAPFEAVMSIPQGSGSARIRDNGSDGKSEVRMVGVLLDSGANRTVTFDSKKLSVSVSPSSCNLGLETGSRFFDLDGIRYLKASAPTTLTWRERWL